MAAIDLVKAPSGATSAELRRLGLKSLGLGALLFVPGLIGFVLAKDWVLATFGTRVGDVIYVPRLVLAVLGGPMAAGYCLFMIGLSRVLFGAASQSKSALASIGRILFGLIVTIGMIVVLTMLFVMATRPA